MSSLYKLYREKFPLFSQSSQYKDFVKNELERALVWSHERGYLLGYNAGVREARKATLDDNSIKLSIIKSNDGFWLTLDGIGRHGLLHLTDSMPDIERSLVELAAKQGAKAPLTEEIAKESVPEGTEDNTPLGDTYIEPRVAHSLWSTINYIANLGKIAAHDSVYNKQALPITKLTLSIAKRRLFSLIECLIMEGTNHGKEKA